MTIRATTILTSVPMGAGFCSMSYSCNVQIQKAGCVANLCWSSFPDSV